jgi:transposase-like protein
MKRSYQVAEASDTRKLAEFLSREGQLLLPILDLITQAEMAVDELIDVAGRAAIEAVLEMSAREVAGPKHAGRCGGDVRWHGRQSGVVSLSDRKIRVTKPRLRRRGKGTGGEVEIPAYDAMRSSPLLSKRILDILMRGVSTRSYKKIIPEMAETVSVSKSAVSERFLEASESRLKELLDRRFDNLDILVIYLDGVIFGSHHVIVALGVDTAGQKHVLGMVQGASENAAAAKSLLEDLVARGLDPKRRRLFVIDGSKALRAAVDAVFGEDNPVQRCRNHKIRNVTDHLPRRMRDQISSTLRAAYRLDPKEGKARLEQQARWLDTEYPAGAASLREGLDETFTVNAMGLPPDLRRCLCTTNIIESPFSGVKARTRRVSRWQDGAMALRWAATAMTEVAKQYRRVLGHKSLWILESYLTGSTESGKMVATERKAG